MKEIKIRNAKLKLKRLVFVKGDSSIYIDSDIKSKLRFHEVYFLNDSYGDRSTFPRTKKIYGESGKIECSLPYDSAWVLIKTDKIDNQEYDEDEKNVIRQVVSSLVRTHINIAEKLVLSLNDLKLEQVFYESYGDLDDLTDRLVDYDPKKLEEPRVLKFTPIYQRTRRYSVYDLINDLVIDKSELLTDKELIGRYFKISRVKDDGSKFIYSKWSKITGKKGNRYRANMSLVISGRAKVEIPENEFGVKPGEVELKAYRSICIIKDGIIWTSQIGVKINNPKLIKKLKSCRVIIGTLMMNNEFLLDLSNLPVVNRNFTRRLNHSSLFYPDIQNELSRIAISYLSKKIWMEEYGVYTKYPETKEEVLELEGHKEDEKEKFLNSLGIYGDFYFPPKTSVLFDDECYYTMEVEKKFIGLPKDSRVNVVNYINKGRCRNPYINELLNSIKAKLDKGVTMEDLKKYYIEIEGKTRKKIMENNFRLVVGKNLLLGDHKDKRADNGTFKFPILGKTIEAKLKVVKKLIIV